MEALKDKQQFTDMVNSDDKVSIAIFRGEWCGDCHFIDPFIDEVAKEYADTIQTFNVDIEEFNDIAGQYEIMGIPSFVAFKGGKEVNRFVNRDRKTREEITNFFQESLLR
ncbi:thioredoxin family protein [Spirochaeta cellobiosiphila]|uniref:thioredoxin family protein n=1 Tax=Spirochaeta cellobiosiphila TaxID=504483 RepID=UPI000426E763|nr:thioredoxin family protein [Spirochaeta cellobiosiphila]